MLSTWLILTILKIFILPFLIVLINFINEDGLVTYCNSRFSFCIKYPKSFVKQPSPENGDGLIFLSKDKETEILAFGSLVIEGLDPLEQEYKLSTNDINLTYKFITKKYFIISGTTKAGKIVYRKTCKRKINYMGEPGTYVFQTLMITYPTSQINIYETFCSYISKSLN